MKDHPVVSRRVLVRSSMFGLLALTLPKIGYSNEALPGFSENDDTGLPHDRYPAIQLEVASEVVGVSHFNLDRLKQLIDPRPELAKAEWDWGFGDWESAIGAASHVGRPDIVRYLVSRGATPTLFTYGMMGEYETVKMMIEKMPGIQKGLGPHGISLLQHARTGLELDGMDKEKARKLIDYLVSLGDADGEKYLEMQDAEKAKYLGDYRYGEGREEGFTIKLNMRKMIALGRLGKSGGALLRLSEDTFTYQGAPSVIVSFLQENDRITSLTLKEPGLTLVARKV
jgi:hypothetical protein